MKFEWIIGKKMNYTLAGLWAIVAIVNFIDGDWFIGMLESLLALNALSDALRGHEVSAVEVEVRKDVK
jgi:hypothetical protein